MAHQFAPHLVTFGMNDWLVESALRAIPEQAADRCLDDRTHCARDLFVHLAVSRHSLCQLLEGKVDPLPWSDVGEAFEAGFKPDGEKPKLATVQAAWQRLAPKFRETLLSASPEVLRKPSPFPVPGITDATLADFVAVNVVHESYHIGQIGMLAKSITGKGLMVPEAAGAGA